MLIEPVGHPAARSSTGRSDVARGPSPPAGGAAGSSVPRPGLPRGEGALPGAGGTAWRQESQHRGDGTAPNREQPRGAALSPSWGERCRAPGGFLQLCPPAGQGGRSCSTCSAVAASPPPLFVGDGNGGSSSLAAGRLPRRAGCPWAAPAGSWWSFSCAAGRPAAVRASGCDCCRLVSCASPASCTNAAAACLSLSASSAGVWGGAVLEEGGGAGTERGAEPGRQG